VTVSPKDSGGGGGEVPFEAEVWAAQFSVNYKKPGNDTLKFTAELTALPQDTAIDGLNVGLNCGGASTMFILNAKGVGKNSLGTCNLKFDKRRRTYFLMISLRKGDWSDAWSEFGVVPATPVLDVTMPLQISLGTQSYFANLFVRYKGTTAKGIGKS
jgi:hypothetical protein